MSANQHDQININVTSEYKALKAVIIHTPGPEVENMTPENAERALYSDILNLSEASKEYSQFKTILNKHAVTLEVQELLCEILKNKEVKESLLTKICMNEKVLCIKNDLMELEPKELARQLIQGMLLKKDNLTDFLSKERYSLRPLHNFFFTRDASITINQSILIGRMANNVREREAIIMEAIFKYHPRLKAKTFNPINEIDFDPKTTIEGGDILIAREDVLLIGNSARTTTEGIDYILEKLKDKDTKRHIIVQELPYTPESFIHLDMTFTFLSENEVMIYEPVILDPNRYKTIHLEIIGKQVKIREENNLLEALKKVKMDVKPILCGGTNDIWIQEREQWHSGANFFALGPAKLLGYGRNVNTLEELNRHGYEIIKANDIIRGKRSFTDYKKYVITIDSSELSRGGGGCRCMTMPICRE